MKKSSHSHSQCLVSALLYPYKNYECGRSKVFVGKLIKHDRKKYDKEFRKYKIKIEMILVFMPRENQVLFSLSSIKTRNEKTAAYQFRDFQYLLATKIKQQMMIGCLKLSCYSIITKKTKN